MPKEPVGIITVQGRYLQEDSRPVVVIEWPNGELLAFELNDALFVGLSMLHVAGKFFDTAAEFSGAIEAVRRQIQTLHSSSFKLQ